MAEVRIARLSASDIGPGRALFCLMAEVLDGHAESLSDPYLERLLARDDFFAVAAWVDGHVVGGLTAHSLPMTRAEHTEVFIYDLAVTPEHKRQGIGRQLVNALRSLAAAAGMAVVFVAADAEDAAATDFYRAIGGQPAAVTIFTFSERRADGAPAIGAHVQSGSGTSTGPAFERF